MKYIKNFISNLMTIIVVWCFLISWFGFKVILIIPMFWLDKIKGKVIKG